MSVEPAAAPSPAGEPTTLFKPTRETKGALIAGRYRLLEEIGEGGMGTVWSAEQTDPVRRRVAIKFIKAGMDTKAVLARFEAERQALAVMDHPNIAKVYDGGRTDDGRPFFVMEFVKGVPITEYCDRARLSVQERLALMVPVCQAVQHAHQKGIIHRDLKPSNILICLYEGQPVPKVIDFGLAKAIHQPLTESTLYTAQGVMIGTPLYMSPEQADPNNLDIDTRTDIYALGVVLYELITGTTPFDRQKFHKVAWEEILRLIKEVEPPKPSTRLSSSESLPSVAAQRTVEPARLSRLVRGELDWIAMKCLEKERSRRYDTAGGLALDLQRYLDGAPVQAAPPSRTYRLQKFMRKNKGPVAAAVLVLLALFAGIAGTTWGMLRADSQRKRAEANEQAAKDSRAEVVKLVMDLQQALVETEKQKQIVDITAKRANAANEQTQKRSEQILKSNEILGSIFKDLNLDKDQRPEESLELVLGRRLKEAAAQLRGEAIGDPLIVADLQNTLASSLLSLGDTSEAIALLEESHATHQRLLEPDNPETLTVAHNLAVAYTTASHYDRAIPLFEKCLDTRKKNLGTTHPDTLTSMNDLAVTYQHVGKSDPALELALETLALRQQHLGPDHQDTIISMNTLAMIHEEVGESALALEAREKIVALAKEKFGPDHPFTLTSMSNLALSYQKAGNLASALSLSQQTLAMRKKKLGANHPDTHTSMNNLAMAHRAAGRLDLALPLYEETLALVTADLGEDHPRTFTSMANLAFAYHAAGKWDLSIPLYEKTLARRRAKLGPGHPSTLLSMNNLANAYCDAGKFDLAMPLCQEALSLQKESLGPDHPHVLVSMNLLAGIHLNAGRLEQAIPLLEETLNLRKAKHGEEHPYTLTSMNNLAFAYQQIEKRDEAVKLLEQVVAIRRRTLDADHPDLLGGMNNLAGAYQDSGRLDLALPLFEQVLAARNIKLDPDHPDRLISLNNYAAAQHLAGKPSEAAVLFTEVFALRKAKLGQDHPDTVSSMINLASAWHDAGNAEQFNHVMQEAAILLERRGFDNLAPGTINHAARLFEITLQFDKAEALRRAWLEIVKQQTGVDSPQTAGELSALGLNLLKQEKWSDAEASLRECLAIREKAEADVWTTFNARSALGEALLGQKKYAEAEPLLAQGYEGLKQREDKIPAEVRVTRQTEALQRLVQLYEALEKPEDVARWKRELEALPMAAGNEKARD